jgi:hypothetical protein
MKEEQINIEIASKSALEFSKIAERTQVDLVDKVFLNNIGVEGVNFN